MLFSFRIQSHQMILGQYSPLAVEFLSYLMAWKNLLSPKQSLAFQECPQNVSLICPHAGGSGWIIHDQMYIVHKCTIHCICHLICWFHQSLSLHHDGRDKQPSPPCFVLASKPPLRSVIASTLMWPATFPNNPASASCPRPVKQQQIIKQHNTSQRQRRALSPLIAIHLNYYTCFQKWSDNCPLTLSVTGPQTHWNKHIHRSVKTDLFVWQGL